MDGAGDWRCGTLYRKLLNLDYHVEWNILCEEWLRQFL